MNQGDEEVKSIDVNKMSGGERYLMDMARRDAKCMHGRQSAVKGDFATLIAF